MSQYQLPFLPFHDHAAINAGNELDENEKCHDSFNFLQETVPPGTSIGNPSAQSSTPPSQNRGPNGSQDKIIVLTAAVAQTNAPFTPKLKHV